MEGWVDVVSPQLSRKFPRPRKPLCYGWLGFLP